MLIKVRCLFSKSVFCPHISDPTMDSSERISRIQNSLKELRKTYHSVKSELAVIERRRKKIRRKEREWAEKGVPANPVEAAAEPKLLLPLWLLKKRRINFLHAWKVQKKKDFYK